MEPMLSPASKTCLECVRRCPGKAVDGKHGKSGAKWSIRACSATCLSASHHR